MEDFEKKLHTLNNIKNTVKMTDLERITMRSHLASMTRGSLAVVRTPSPYHSYFSFHKMIRVTVFVVIGIVIGGGSISYIGASTALPGDILYPVKTNIIEPAKGVFATSPESKLSYQENLMQTRLDEIDTLTKENKLNDQVVTEVNQAVNAQADQFDTAIVNVEKTGNTTLANEKSVRLVNELERRESLLRTKKIDDGATVRTVEPRENKIADELKNRRIKMNKRLGIHKDTPEINLPIEIVPTTINTIPLEDSKLNQTNLQLDKNSMVNHAGKQEVLKVIQ
jgi:Domain of unknown function (DUF5667)